MDLEPGDMACWPQNAPHRVTNLDVLNVSLSTEHVTRESRGRARVYCANRFLRRRLGYREGSTSEHGVRPLLKYVFYRAAKAAGLDDTTEEATATAILASLRLPTAAPPLARARDPTDEGVEHTSSDD